MDLLKELLREDHVAQQELRCTFWLGTKHVQKLFVLKYIFLHIDLLKELSKEPYHATGILGSPKFTKACARAMRPNAASQETRWFINTLTYFALSFCEKRENKDGHIRNSLLVESKREELSVTL